jgi:ribonuclease P protein component
VITALSRREDFLRVRSSGIMRRSGPLRARVVLADALPVESVKLGFSIGKKFGNAVQRNRMRRRLRHSVAQAVTAGDVRASHVLLGASPAALDETFSDLVVHCQNLIGVQS